MISPRIASACLMSSSVRGLAPPEGGTTTSAAAGLADGKLRAVELAAVGGEVGRQPLRGHIAGQKPPPDRVPGELPVEVGLADRLGLEEVRQRAALGGKPGFQRRRFRGHFRRRRRLAGPPGVGQHQAPGDDLFEQLRLKEPPRVPLRLLPPRGLGQQPLDLAGVDRLVADRGDDGVSIGGRRRRHGSEAQQHGDCEDADHDANVSASMSVIAGG